MRSDCIYRRGNLRPDPLGELTVPQDSPLNLWEGGAIGKGERAGRI